MVVVIVVKRTELNMTKQIKYALCASFIRTLIEFVVIVVDSIHSLIVRGGGGFLKFQSWTISRSLSPPRTNILDIPSIRLRNDNYNNLSNLFGNLFVDSSLAHSPQTAYI